MFPEAEQNLRPRARRGSTSARWRSFRRRAIRARPDALACASGSEPGEGRGGVHDSGGRRGRAAPWTTGGRPSHRGHPTGGGDREAARVSGHFRARGCRPRPGRGRASPGGRAVRRGEAPRGKAGVASDRRWKHDRRSCSATRPFEPRPPGPFTGRMGDGIRRSPWQPRPAPGCGAHGRGRRDPGEGGGDGALGGAEARRRGGGSGAVTTRSTPYPRAARTAPRAAAPGDAPTFTHSRGRRTCRFRMGLLIALRFCVASPTRPPRMSSEMRHSLPPRSPSALNPARPREPGDTERTD